MNIILAGLCFVITYQLATFAESGRRSYKLAFSILAYIECIACGCLGFTLLAWEQYSRYFLLVLLMALSVNLRLCRGNVSRVWRPEHA